MAMIQALTHGPSQPRALDCNTNKHVAKQTGVGVESDSSGDGRRLSEETGKGECGSEQTGKGVSRS